MRIASGLAVFILSGAVFAGKLQAATLEVSPVVIDLVPGQTVATIEVRNHDAKPLAVQARAYLWAQAGDKDTLVPTDDIIISPPIFTVPAGDTQTVRLLMRNTAAAGIERTYRLLIDEVPSADAPKRQVTIALRLSIPVTAGPATGGAEMLHWTARHDATGHTVLVATNAGPVHAKVGAIDVVASDGTHPKLVAVATNPYVLAGGERSWTVQGYGAHSGPLHLSVTTDKGKTEQTVSP